MLYIAGPHYSSSKLSLLPLFVKCSLYVIVCSSRTLWQLFKKIILASFLYNDSHEYLISWVKEWNLNCLNWTSMVLLDHNSMTPVWSGCVLVSLSGSVSVLRSLGPGEVVLVAVIFSTWHSLPSPAPAICIEGFRNPNSGNWRKN